LSYFQDKEQTLITEVICADSWSCVFHTVEEKQPGKYVTFSISSHEISAYYLKCGIPDFSYPQTSAIQRALSVCQQPKTKQG